MIHYNLRCGEGHGFDGWFRSSAAFDQQAASGLLDCPVCTSTVIARALMAPSLSRGAAAPEIETRREGATIAGSPDAGAPSVGISNAADATPAPDAGRDLVRQGPAMAVGGAPAIPDQVRAVLQRIRAEIERKCDYVGPRFAEEARAIHNGDQPARPIYGETTPDQAEALSEDGIDIARIPWVPRADG